MRYTVKVRLHRNTETDVRYWAEAKAFERGKLVHVQAEPGTFVSRLDVGTIGLVHCPYGESVDLALLRDVDLDLHANPLVPIIIEGRRPSEIVLVFEDEEFRDEPQGGLRW